MEMSRGIIVIAVALLIGCVLVGGGCGDSETSGGVPAGWVTLEGGSVSLALPDTFKGGDPSDPEVVATLREMAAGHPNPSFGAAYQSYLDNVETGLADGVEIELLVWGELGAQGHLPMVEVGVLSLPGGSSLREYVESYLAVGYPGATVESATEDQVCCVVHRPSWADPDVIVPVYKVHRLAGRLVYIVEYIFDDELNAALESTFRASAETIEVRGYGL